MKKYSTWVWILGLVVAFLVFAKFDKKPCDKIPPVPSYLYDVGSYRNQRMQNELEEVDKNGGDKFDREAARKRVLAMSDVQLESERQSELAFVTKVYEKAREGCSN
jgi:hypothetical protein